MKKLISFIICLSLLVSLNGCSNNDKHNFYGTYNFEEVSYLSSLSSLSIDYLEKKMLGTKYTIKDNLFKIEYTDSDNTIDISSPDYTNEEIPNDIDVLCDVRSFIGDEVESQYSIYTEDGSKTVWRLYVSSNYLWIAACGSENIMNIIKLSKQ